MICAKTALIEAENLGDTGEKSAFPVVQLAIGHGDLEERAQKFFPHRGVVRKDLDDLLSIRLEAFRLTPSLVPDPPHRSGVGVGNAEDPLERVDLLAGDAAVRLRHLGREHDQGDGDCSLLGLLIPCANAPDTAATAGHAVHEVASRHAQDRADGAAECESRGAPDHLAPDAQPTRASASCPQAP